MEMRVGKKRGWAVAVVPKPKGKKGNSENLRGIKFKKKGYKRSRSWTNKG